MVKEGVKDLDRVILHHTSDYIISAATFPTYFMKEKTEAERQTAVWIMELFGKGRTRTAYYKAFCRNLSQTVLSLTVTM